MNIMEQLANILHDMYHDGAKQRKIVPFIQLFGIKYAKQTANMSRKDLKYLVDRAGLPPTYDIEIDYGKRLVEYVTIKDDARSRLLGSKREGLAECAEDVTEKELANLLCDLLYYGDKEKRKTAALLVFGIKYAEQIANMSIKDIIIAAGVQEHDVKYVRAEINKGKNLAEYVTVKDDAISRLLGGERRYD